MFEKVNVKILGIIENMTSISLRPAKSGIFGNGGGAAMKPN
jgi:Mrp family chromosome partitioning ATPase